MHAKGLSRNVLCTTAGWNRPDCVTFMSMSTPKLPKGPPQFDLDGLLAEMRRRGWTSMDLVKRCPAINKGSLHQVLNGLPPSPRIAAAIAHALKGG